MKYKYKVCVYAICKNEEKFIERWYNSMKEADEIYVLDTGSTDNSFKILNSLGVFVNKKEIKPWRFDVARNESLELVPLDTDICVCTDIDEVFEPGWREKLESVWNNDTNRLKYNYNWSFNEYGTPIVNFYIEKIHARNGYKWIHPVHEVLKYADDNEKIITTDLITVNHYPDSGKSRNSYLSLLEMSVQEDPEDDRNMHYLGREYMYYGRWNECIDTLISHLKLKRATWRDERAASMRFIARSYTNLNRYDEAIMWLDKAISEAPYLRDAYVEMAITYYKIGQFDNVIKYCDLALKITEKTKSYINEVFSWDYTIYDLLSIAYFYTNRFEESFKYSTLALQMDKNNKRLQSNNDIIKKFIKKTEVKD